jgi:hypothetical protein
MIVRLSQCSSLVPDSIDLADGHLVRPKLSFNNFMQCISSVSSLL